VDISSLSSTLPEGSLSRRDAVFGRPGPFRHEDRPSPLIACSIVLGEREATVREVRLLDVHGARYADVTVGYSDGVLESARLGAESIPDDLQAGEQVWVSRAVNMIVAIRRP
jgi:hypothetical protein